MGAFVSKPIVVDQLLGVLNDLTAVSKRPASNSPHSAAAHHAPDALRSGRSILMETLRRRLGTGRAPAILFDDLLQRCSGNDDFARKILEKFRQRMPTAIDAICDAAAELPPRHLRSAGPRPQGGLRQRQGDPDHAPPRSWSSGPSGTDAGNPAWYVAQLREEQRLCEEWFAAATAAPDLVACPCRRRRHLRRGRPDPDRPQPDLATGAGCPPPLGTPRRTDPELKDCHALGRLPQPRTPTPQRSTLDHECPDCRRR